MAFIYKKIGKEKEASEIIDNCKKSIENQLTKNLGIIFINSQLKMNLISIHLMLNEKEKALTYLNEAAQYDINIINGLEKNPEFEKIHDDPEFKALVKQAQDEKASIWAQIQEMEKRGELNL